ncbi:MAG: hypothetical protein AAGA96_02930 [Verrucomicrobiota bacterium]
MNHKAKHDDLIQTLLNGEADSESLRRLADLMGNDATLASRVREELSFSELLRQGFREGPFDSETIEESAASASAGPEAWIAKVLDGKASEFECNQLAKYLWESPERVGDLKRRLAEEEWLVEALSEAKSEESFVEALETRMWAETRQDRFVDEFSDRLELELLKRSSGAGEIISFPSPRNTILAMTGVAAALAVGAFLVVQNLSSDLREHAMVASVTKASDDVRWSGDLKPDLEGGIEPGRYELESGVVALEFSAGAEMIVEGPAIFRVDDDASAYVYHGVAMARADDPQQALDLRSDAISVASPATLIGIDATSEFSTDAIVFEGDGGICLNDGSQCRSIFAFEAIKADHTREKLIDIPYNPRAFSRGWEMLSGVQTNVGDVRIEMPGAEIEAADGTGEVQVFVENQAFRPETALEVDELETGQFATVNANEGQRLKANGALRSYLVQLSPSDLNKEVQVEASLTFDHPVVGVIFSSDRLADSDQSVGSSIRDLGGDFSQVRGLDSDHDQLLLSDDGRTLNLKLQGGENELDQVRVLVALN